MVTSYEALDLGRYMKINAVLQDDTLEEVDKQVRIIAILDGKTEDEVLALPMGEYGALAAQTAFLREPLPPRQLDPDTKEIRLGENTYQLTRDFTKITTAQYVDFQTFSKGFPQTLPEILSCFLVPDGKTYNNGYDPADVQRDLLAMPWPEAVSLSAFFFARFSASIADSLTSLDLARRMAKDPKKRKVLERKIAEAEAALRRVGVGLPM